MASEESLIPAERIEQHILLIRSQKVMLDADLAGLYEVATRVLVQAVGRNRSRFPDDFMFQLSEEEVGHLRSQSVISNKGRGGRSTGYRACDNGLVAAMKVTTSAAMRARGRCPGRARRTWPVPRRPKPTRWLAEPGEPGEPGGRGRCGRGRYGRGWCGRGWCGRGWCGRGPGGCRRCGGGRCGRVRCGGGVRAGRGR